MNILVTGGAGFIGSHLIDRLLERGDTVTAYDNLSLGRLSNLEDALKNSRFQLVRGDILDEETFFAAVQASGAERIYHLAANSDIARSHANPDVDFDNTFRTTYQVLKAMKEFGIREIQFASTSAIYGETTCELTETYGPLFPASHYGAGKLASEAFIASFCENYEIRAWITRFPNVVGERSTHGVIRDFIRKLRRTPECLEVLGNGEQIKPYLYVRDLVDAILFVVDHTTDRINYFNIGVESRTKVKDIARMVLEEMGLRAEIRYTGGDRGWVGDVPEFHYNLDKIHALGWRAETTSDEAVRKAIRYILEVDQCSL